MKKVLLVAAAIVAAAPTWADWSRTFSDERKTQYIDPSTLRFVGKTRRLWVLHDFRSRTQDGDLSEASLVEIDCENERMRSLQTVAYKSAMASGEGHASSKVPSEWGYYPPKTMGGVMVKSFCSVGQ